MSKFLSNKEKHEKDREFKGNRNRSYDEMIGSSRSEKIKERFYRKPYSQYHHSTGGK